MHSLEKIIQLGHRPDMIDISLHGKNVQQVCQDSCNPLAMGRRPEEILLGDVFTATVLTDK